MRQITAKMWNDEAGFIVSIELVLIATIAVIGLLAGITSVRDAVISELSDVAGAVQDVNQSYMYFGVLGHSGSTAGATYEDRTDFCDQPNDDFDQIDNCISIEFQNVIDEYGFVQQPTGTFGFFGP